MYTLRHGSGDKKAKKIFQESNRLIEHADTESAKQIVKTQVNCNILLKNDPKCLRTWRTVSFIDTLISREPACMFKDGGRQLSFKLKAMANSLVRED